MSLPSDVASTDFLDLADLYLLNALLFEIQENLNLLSKGAQGQVVTVNGGNLYQLAAQYYGDATLWTNIAKANGLVDPKIQDGTILSLVIPVQTLNTDGVYQSP